MPSVLHCARTIDANGSAAHTKAQPSAGRLDRVREPRASLSYQYEAVIVPDLPDALKCETLYLIGERECYWAAAMLCPCGCTDTVHLNLLPDVRPRWQAHRHRDGTVTIDPSVWRTKGCKSHYYIRAGKIVWVGADANAG